MNAKRSMIRPGMMLAGLLTITGIATAKPEVSQSGNIVTLRNERVHLDFDLTTGTYSLFNQSETQAVISKARLRINDWASDAPGVERKWHQRPVTDTSGSGIALDLEFKSPASPELRFTFALYGEQEFFSASGGIFNSGKEPVRIKDIHVLADGVVHDGVDMTKDFAMIDGFSGGEPLEYGRRLYSPLTRSNALKSRNNILLTFSQGKQRRVLVMGGLTYHDFEKVATIAQKRRTELELGKDQQGSLLCYLNLPADKSDHSAGGESLVLAKGEQSRTWENHQFRNDEVATSVMEKGTIIVEAGGLQKDHPYTLGFSWWQGLRHGEHPDLVQSVFVEFEQDGVLKKLPLLENQTLPRFDAEKKQEPEQVELPLPVEAIRAGKLRVLVEKGPPSLTTRTRRMGMFT